MSMKSKITKIISCTSRITIYFDFVKIILSNFFVVNL